MARWQRVHTDLRARLPGRNASNGRAGRQVMLVDQAGNQMGAAAVSRHKESDGLAGPGLQSQSRFRHHSQCRRTSKVSIRSVLCRTESAHRSRMESQLQLMVFSARSSAAIETVIRGGYSRIFGRLNGVAQVLNPLARRSVCSAGLVYRRQHVGLSAWAQAV